MKVKLKLMFVRKHIRDLYVHGQHSRTWEFDCPPQRLFPPQDEAAPQVKRRKNVLCGAVRPALGKARLKMTKAERVRVAREAAQAKWARAKRHGATGEVQNASRNCG
jgi:hypothetical protein